MSVIDIKINCEGDISGQLNSLFRGGIIVKRKGANGDLIEILNDI